jgi:hypothetical protein
MRCRFEITPWTPQAAALARVSDSVGSLLVNFVSLGAKVVGSLVLASISLIMVISPLMCERRTLFFSVLFAPPD